MMDSINELINFYDDQIHKLIMKSIISDNPSKFINQISGLRSELAGIRIGLLRCENRSDAEEIQKYLNKFYD